MGSGKINLYQIGQGGVNVTKDPLHLADNELSQAQNAEILEDVNTGGYGALSKRGGLAGLTSAPLAGTVTGIFPFPILTTYTRTLYVAQGTAGSDTFRTSTDNTTFTDTTVPNAPVSPPKYTNENDIRTFRRFAAWNNLIFYAGNNYTSGSTNPDLQVFDGTTGLQVTTIQIGPNSTSSSWTITDMLTANGKIYIAVHDQGGSAPNTAGRVLALDPITSNLFQVLNAFGQNTGEVAGGYPGALLFYQGQLWAGLNSGNSTDGIGTLVRCHPDTDTSWTTEKSNFVQSITTMCSFLGDLYVGTTSSSATGAQIYKRASGTGTWTSQITSASGASGQGHFAQLLVSPDQAACYVVEYFQSTDVLKIRRTTDGSTWSVDRDVEANDSPASPPQFPGGAIETNNNDILYCFRATSGTNTDGFIMRRRSGTWSKVDTDNHGGPLIVLTTRS